MGPRRISGAEGPTDMALTDLAGSTPSARLSQPEVEPCIRPLPFAALQHVLGLEMRAGAVGGGDGRGDAGLALQRQGVDGGQLGVQGEVAVELERLIGWDGDVAPQALIGAIADGRRDGEPVHAAAADDDHQLLPGQVTVGGRVRGAGGEDDRGASAGGAARRVISNERAHRRWNSGDSSAGSSWLPCRLSAESMAACTGGVRRLPRDEAAIFIGSTSAFWAAKFCDQARRLTTWSGAAQVAASSAQPLGEGGGIDLLAQGG